MNIKHIFFYAFLLACFLVVPATTASAQYRNDPYYGRDDDRYGRDDDRYGRNDDRYERNRRRDRYDDRNRNNSRYVRDAVKRLEDNSDHFRKALDRALDDSRYDNSRREDNILNVASQFEEATDDLSESYNNRNADQKVRLVLDLGSRLDRFVNRNRLDGRTENLWSQIRQDLRTVADAYGYQSGGIFDNGDYRRDRNYPRRRNTGTGVGDILGDIFGRSRY